MKQIVTGLAILIIGFTSCNKEAQPLTKQQISQKVDSITQIRAKELDDQARLDLERRMKIEVKVKVDSMVNASLNGQAKAAPAAHMPVTARPGRQALPPNAVSK